MTLSFTILSGDYAIARLPYDALVPSWADGAGLVTITRALDELSITCLSDRIPADVTAQTGWAALRIDTLADLDAAGVVIAAVTPVSTAGYGVFVISSHLRDHLLVRHIHLDAVTSALTQAGHNVA